MSFLVCPKSRRRVTLTSRSQCDPSRFWERRIFFISRCYQKIWIRLTMLLAMKDMVDFLKWEYNNDSTRKKKQKKEGNNSWISKLFWFCARTLNNGRCRLPRQTGVFDLHEHGPDKFQWCNYAPDRQPSIWGHSASLKAVTYKLAKTAAINREKND